MEQTLQEKIRDLIKQVCKEEGWDYRASDQVFSHPMYPDRGDCVLSSKEGKKVMESEDPRGELDDIVFRHWDDFAGNMIGEIIDIVQERLESEEERKNGLLLYDQIYEETNEIMFPEYPLEDYLKEEYLVNLIVDCGDGNTDFGENNFPPHYNSRGEDIKISKESSLLWLVKQQGRTKRDLVRVIKKAGKTEDSFLQSIYQEVNNATSCMNALTFLVKMKMRDMIHIQEAINRRDKDGFKYEANKRSDVGSIVIPKTCMCGLVDYWYGAGSVLDIALEKDVVLPIKYLRSAGSDDWENYSIHSIYGMSDRAWRVEATLQIKQEKEA